MRSLQSRLGSGLILSLIAVFSVLWLLVSSGIQSLADEYIASRLRHDAEMLLSTVNFDANGNLVQDETGIDLVYTKPFSGHYYLITSAGQVISSRSLWDHSLSHAEVSTGQIIRSYQDGPDKQLLLVIDNGFSKQGRSLSVTVAEDLNPVIQSISQFQSHFAMTALGLLFLLVILQAFILHHSLRSLARVRSELKQLQQGKIEQLGTDLPTELQPLVSEVNHLLNIMTQQLHRSRDVLGDLAHAIKKPLTVMQQLTDKHRDTMPAELQETLAKQIIAINRLTDRILKRARLAGHHHGGVRFSLAQDLPDLINAVEIMYSEKSISIQVEMDKETDYQIDREDMLELLGNLLDNACKWANSIVKISIRAKSGISICIEDDGPGADPEMLQQLDKRGVRLDETKQGYGLGLAIVSDMIREYQGSLVFGRSEKLGGFRVDVTLPAGEG
ncbi:MAG TPA: GHKL domain-containing protein [Gammaproteobacteria bacterium]|nr:GHKL domain-containing protein [Gammaproteobacteria bacterium]